MHSKRSPSFEYMARPVSQRLPDFFNLSTSWYRVWSSKDWSAASVWQPYSTHRNIPPAEYCVKDRRDSLAPRAALEWMGVAVGLWMVEPGGNSIANFKSQSMRWPPLVASKFPRAVIAHQPNGRFWESRCINERTRGPKFMVAHAKVLPAKLRDTPILSSTTSKEWR